MIETYRGMVTPIQVDHMEHMNVQWNTSKFDEATWQLFSAIGITSEYVRKQNKGMVALEQITKYRSEVISGELLVIKSKVVEISNKTIKFLHIMYNIESSEEVATTEIVGVHIDRTRRKSCLLPTSVKKKCTELFDLTT